MSTTDKAQAAPRAGLTLPEKLAVLYEDMRMANAAFSLPMAYVGMLLASRGWPSWTDLAWVTLAVLGGRNFGHGVNQIADRDIDAAHPAKRNRALPSGKISLAEMALATGLMGVIFLAATWQLNTLSFIMTPIAMAYFVFYAYSKRFTPATNLAMGATTSMAIVGGWIGVTGELTWEPFFLFAASYFWVAGFDLTIDTRDYAFEAKQGLHTMISVLGVRGALLTARVFYAVSALLFLALGPLFHLGLGYYPFWALAAGTLYLQQRMYDPQDFTLAWKVFFRYNAIFSAFLMLGALAGVLWP
jgi:4-hydroxybenzoate polyprenyltransferase